MSKWLFEKMMVPCHMVDRTTSVGPFGPVTDYKEGAAIKATIVRDGSMQARVAEHEGVLSVFTITAPKTVKFEKHDVIRRDSDGATFRVTTPSEDSTPPEVASFGFVQVAAERWEIPAK